MRDFIDFDKNTCKIMEDRLFKLYPNGYRCGLEHIALPHLTIVVHIDIVNDSRYKLLIVNYDYDIDRKVLHLEIPIMQLKCDIEMYMLNYNAIGYCGTDKLSDPHVYPMIEQSIRCYELINRFILLYEKPEDIMEIEVKAHKNKPKPNKSKKNNKKHNQVTLYKCYKLKKDWKTVKPKTTHTITCDAWGVRGHYRHYQNGKTVFIKPYVKGKNKENYQGKQYKISKD